MEEFSHRLLQRQPGSWVIARLFTFPIWERNLLFQALRQKGLLFKASPISSKALWQHLPTVRKSTKKTIIPRSGVYENTCAPTTEHSKRATKNTTPPFPARRIRALKRWTLCATAWSIQRRSSKKSI